MPKFAFNRPVTDEQYHALPHTQKAILAWNQQMGFLKRGFACKPLIGPSGAKRRRHVGMYRAQFTGGVKKSRKPRWTEAQLAAMAKGEQRIKAAKAFRSLGKKLSGNATRLKKAMAADAAAIKKAEKKASSRSVEELKAARQARIVAGRINPNPRLHPGEGRDLSSAKKAVGTEKSKQQKKFERAMKKLQ
jgi:hypothetical protein